MPTAENVQRQIAVAVVIAVEVPALLIAIDRIIRGIEIDHDAPGPLDDGDGAEIAHRPRDVLLESPQEERAIAALEADLVIVDDDAGVQLGVGHASPADGFGCLGRRRYMVFGTSTLGGLRGMGLRTWACSGFLRFTRSVYATWKSVNVRPQPDRLVHLHTAPGASRGGARSRRARIHARLASVAAARVAGSLNAICRASWRTR